VPVQPTTIYSWFHRFRQDGLEGLANKPKDHWKAARRWNSQTFIEFLEHLFVDCYPTGHFILVLDNASIHISGAAMAALSLFAYQARVNWLPAYCSGLNLIERFWCYLKEQVSVNKLYPKINELV
jgi:transposase